MTRYRIFGNALDSDIALPSLRPSELPAGRWRLRTVRHSLPPEAGEQLGADVQGICRTSVHRQGDGLLYRHSCTGAFALEAEGTDISWYPAEGADEDVVQNDVMGRLMALALHLGGFTCLHGSAIAFEQGAGTFLAPKGYGKSTLAAALVEAGGRLVSDDTVAVTPDRMPMVMPGIPHLRLRHDSAAHALSGAADSPQGGDGKHVVTDLADGRLLDEAAPLSAIYILAPVPADGRAPVVRTPMPGVHAAMSLVQHTKVGVLLRGSEAPAVFDRASRLAQRVPVYELAIARDLHRLPEVVATIGNWHGGFRGAPVPAPA